MWFSRHPVEILRIHIIFHPVAAWLRFRLFLPRLAEIMFSNVTKWAINAMSRLPLSCNACESLLKFKSYMSFNKILVYFRVFVFTSSYYYLQIWILTFAHRHLSITRHRLIFIISSRVTDWLERNNNFCPFKLFKGEEGGGIRGALFPFVCM